MFKNGKVMYWQCATPKLTEEVTVEPATEGYRAVFAARHNKTGKAVRMISANGASSVEALKNLAPNVGNADFTAYVALM
jgi:hypothetical protein